MALLSEMLEYSTEKLSHLDIPWKRVVLMLRWTLFLSLLGLGFATQVDISESILLNVALGMFLVSNLVVTVLPESMLRASPFEFSLSLLDTAIVSYVAFQADASGILCLFFFILLIGTAASMRMGQVVTGSVVLSLLYLLLCALRPDGDGIFTMQRLMVMPLFYATGIYFGYHVIQIRERQAQVQGVFRERQELKYVLNILESITSSLDFHTVMFQIASRIAEVVDAIRCSILLVEENSKDRAFVVAANDDRKLKMLPVELSKYPEVMSAIEQKKPVIIEDIEKSELMRPYVEELLKLNFHSLLVLPIVYQDTVVGTLFLRASRKRSFSVDELKFCRVVAHAAASAIKNSMLYQKLEQHARELEQTGDRIRVMFDHSPDIILQLDSDGTVREANRTLERLSGLSRSNILGESVDRLLLGLPDTQLLLQRVAEGPAPAHYPATLASRDRTGRDLTVTVAPLSEPAASLLLIGKDVTEQNQTAAMLQQTDKLSSIGEIVAGVAHELNNPLSGVLGFSQLLAQKDAEGKFRRDIERIVDCAGRCQKIVQNLLSFARPGNPEKKPVGLNGILEKTLDLLEPALHADSIDVVKELTPNLPYVLADFHQVQQVLTNLINNAHQAMNAEHNGGTLTLRTLVRQDRRVCIQVGDDGPGIPAEVLPKIFDPFFSTKKQGRGTGLGLSVSFGIVRDHGGELLVDSRAGGGTTFSVLFPPYVAQEASAQKELSASPQIDGKEILVVDDEEMIVELYLQLLQALGHSIDTASTGVEALRKIEERDYDLVITDIKMPRMSGIQLYEKTMEIKPAMRRRFIFITGDMNSLTSKQFSTVTDNPCLLKPVNIEKIEATIREVLAANPSPSELPLSRN
jgi:PAS domain S-box-containing protein